MKVIVKSLKQEVLEERGYKNRLIIEADGEDVFSVWDGSPEDNSLYRNFRSCFKIGRLMKKAFEAGRNGEEFELSEEELDDEW